MSKTKKVTAKSLGLPETLFVYMEEDSDSVYFIANDSVDNVASFNEEKFVGIYKFQKLIKVNAVATVEDA